MTKAVSWRHCLSSHWSRHWIKFYFSKRQQNELIGNLCVFIKLLFCFLHGLESTVQLTFSNQLLCKCERQTFWCQKMLHLINADILIRPDGAFGENKVLGWKVHFGDLCRRNFRWFKLIGPIDQVSLLPKVAIVTFRKAFCAKINNNFSKSPTRHLLNL